uniref:Uncharacterized protein n=1 Tax=Malurus cyaneus samueli TaxID=2593467 RepID=A0A8C5T5W3_9PASS
PRPTLGTTAPWSLSPLGSPQTYLGGSSGLALASPTPLTSLGSKEMKSRWNCGSMTCIMYLICAGSQRSMSSSRASSFSGPLQRCRESPSDPWLCVLSQRSHIPGIQGSCPRHRARARWELGHRQWVTGVV